MAWQPHFVSPHYPWMILKQSQYDLASRQYFSTSCKQIKFFPTEDKKTKEINWRRFKYPLWKMIISHVKENKDHVILLAHREQGLEITYKFPNGESIHFTSLEQLQHEFRGRGIIMDLVVMTFRRIACHT